MNSKVGFLLRQAVTTFEPLHTTTFEFICVYILKSFHLLLFFSFAFGEANEGCSPWLTGPLIAPPGEVIPLGEVELQTFIECTTFTGTYNGNWTSVPSNHNFFSLNPQAYLYIGLAKRLDINLVPNFFYNKSQGKSSVRFGDFPVILDFQLLSPEATAYFPGVMLFIEEVFPTGTYDRLSKEGIEESGQGCFTTALGLVLYKVYPLGGCHFLSTTYSLSYAFSTNPKVKGVNAYGGVAETKGRVFVGNSFEAIVSFEITLSQNWVFAIDNVYIHTDASRFSGTWGKDAFGEDALVGTPSSEQISFAPSIEYNVSQNLGIIAGCWLSGFGRNSPVFRSGIVNCVYTY